MLDPNTFVLTLEQQFSLQNTTNTVSRMSKAQLEELVVQLHALLLRKDNVIRGLVKKALL